MLLGYLAAEKTNKKPTTLEVVVQTLTQQLCPMCLFQIAVLIANAIGNMLQPSFYDSIIQIKRLPYLPDIQSSRSK